MGCMLRGKSTFKQCPDAQSGEDFKRCFEKLMLRFTVSGCYDIIYILPYDS